MRKFTNCMLAGSMIMLLTACGNLGIQETSQSSVSETGSSTAAETAAEVNDEVSETIKNAEGLLVIREQGNFSVGGTVIEVPGEYVSQNFDSWQLYPEGQTYHGDHASVSYQIPENGNGLPMVFLHGAGQSARSWQTTPDGRDGFQNLFLRRGFSTYLIDQPRRGQAGRSTQEVQISPVADEQMWFEIWRMGHWPEYSEQVQFPQDEESLEQFFRWMTPNTGSFSKAAGEAFITPTAVIKQINLLEAKLGVQLFIRTHRGLTLTESGRSLYQDAKYIIQYSTDSITRARNAMQQTESMIRIGTSPITPGEFMLELWPSIQTYCPDVKFQLVPYENTPENAREILKNLGRHIDIVAGLFDEEIGRNRGCKALELEKTPVRAAVSIHNPLAEKDYLTPEDMHGEQLMLIRRGWNVYVDMVRDEIWKNHQEIEVVDFDFYNLGIFNQCENSNHLLMAVDSWSNVHPLLKIMPVDWSFTVPSGILYSPEPSEAVQKFISAVKMALELKDD